MKKIDRLLIGSFIPPFIVTSFIAMFVLIMQFLWTYIDDIVGKGASIGLILEIIFYLSMSLIPTALPIAILISSVMVMGNMAERYELASMKSAGVPLLRVMLPLLYFASVVGIFSFICSNNLIPIANLQFKSRLYDIRKQKPTLSLEEHTFNDDFKGYIIHIGYKGEDDSSIGDVLIYDHKDSKGQANILTAEKGEMFMTDDQQYFVMKLFNGTQYQESASSGAGKDKTYPFVRTSFKEWTKIFDLTEFELKETDKDLFKSHQSMLSSSQLVEAVDSIDSYVVKRKTGFKNHFNQYFYFLKPKKKKPERKNVNLNIDKNKKQEEKSFNKISNLMGNDTTLAYPNVKKPTKKGETTASKKQTKTPLKKKKKKKNRKIKKSEKKKKIEKKSLQQDTSKILTGYKSIVETFPADKKRNLNSKAKSYARSIHGQAETTIRVVDKQKEKRIKHIYELHSKFSMAFVCLIFLFIGAPMGAIVKKGGFGWPLIISIVFFISFIVMNIFSEKLGESEVLPPILAAWLPCLILLPIGMTLTYRAMNDLKIMDISKYVEFLRPIINILKAFAGG